MGEQPKEYILLNSGFGCHAVSTFCQR